MAKVVSINQAEAIFAPLFDMKISNMHELTLIEKERSDGKLVQMWDSCAIISKATDFSVKWEGSIVLKEYDTLRFFINYHSHLLLSGTAVVNGAQYSLFRNIPGSNVPLEPTSKPLKNQDEVAELTEITLNFHCTGGCPGKHHISLYWMGLLASDKEYLIEEELPKYDVDSWKGLFNPEGKPSINYELFFTREQLLKMKKRLDEPLFIEISKKLKLEAKRWENFVPEKEIREYLPAGEHLYRYVRIRDRGRTPLDNPIIILAVAGYLFDNPTWTRLAARMVLSVAHTPKWFEGPQACMEGSTWHHVCFMEDHTLSAVALALSFIGNTLTPKGIEKVLDSIENAWKRVNTTCEQPGYRWYMNQGLVGNRGRIIGAYCLSQYGRDYEAFIERSYLDHTTIVNNYLNEEGHCPEGPWYYQYSFINSILVWLAYANYKGIEVRKAIPKRVKVSLKYVECFMTSNNDLGYTIPVSTTHYAPFDNMLLVFYATVFNWERAYYYIHNRIKTGAISKIAASGLDLLLLLNFMPKRFPDLVNNSCKTIVFYKSGVFSYEFKNPCKGKLLFLCERNPLTGHYNEDRGSFILEANGKTLLLDPGTTNYSNVASVFMSKAEYHNTAYPEGLSMKICNPKAQKSADEAGIGCTTVISMKDFTYQGPRLEYVEEIENGVKFAADMRLLYGEEVKMAKRVGKLKLASDGGMLVINDLWQFNVERSLYINFLSYVPWNIKDNYAETFIEDMKIEIYFMEKNELEMQLIVDEFMIDSNLNRVYTLRLKTIPAKNIEVISSIRFLIS